jgi:hypothetical protein
MCMVHMLDREPTQVGQRGEERSVLLNLTVATAKALHLLAPDFLPLWDATIARHYRCTYTREPHRKYVRFCLTMKAMADAVKDYYDHCSKTLLKVIDEYNYASYAKL